MVMIDDGHLLLRDVVVVLMVLMIVAAETVMTTYSSSTSIIPASAFVAVPPQSYIPISIHHRRSAALFHHQYEVNDRRAFVTSSISSTLPIISLFTASASAKPANAITPEEASKSYDTYAASYDKLDGGSIASTLGIHDARKKLFNMARGDVLEIGVGTGLNLDAYDFDDIRSLTLLDISGGMLEQAKLRVERMKEMGIINNTSIKFVQADATAELAAMFGEDRFDTVIDTFSLCVMGNEGARNCLEEMTRVVKKAEDGGEIYMFFFYSGDGLLNIESKTLLLLH